MVKLANVFVMRMLYVKLVLAYSVFDASRIGLRQLFPSWILLVCGHPLLPTCFFMVFPRIYYAHQRGVHIVIEQPLTSVWACV